MNFRKIILWTYVGVVIISINTKTATALVLLEVCAGLDIVKNFG